MSLKARKRWYGVRESQQQWLHAAQRADQAGDGLLADRCMLEASKGDHLYGAAFYHQKCQKQNRPFYGKPTI